MWIRSRHTTLWNELSRTSLMGGDGVRITMVDGKRPQAPTLQALFEGALPSGSRYSGRCTSVSMLLACCCHRFRCWDMQRMTDAIRMAIPRMAMDRSQLAVYLCRWQTRLLCYKTLSKDALLSIMAIAVESKSKPNPVCGVLLPAPNGFCTASACSVQGTIARPKRRLPEHGYALCANHMVPIVDTPVCPVGGSVYDAV